MPTNVAIRTEAQAPVHDLPPVDSYALAAKSDIHELRGEHLARIASAQATMTATMTGTMIGLSGRVLAVAGFAG